MANLVFPIKGRSLPPSIGSKAGQVRLLLDKGFLIPESWVIPWEAHQRYLDGDEAVIADLKTELAQVLRPDAAYAVRSSADVEDTLETSYAGQFKSALNRKGVDSVLEAVWSVWATANTSGTQRYQQRSASEGATVRMGVLVQEMVPAVHAGVVFSRNPMTGANEIVVEAVSGLGTQLVQDGATPNRWVNRGGRWVVRSDDSGIPLTVIQQVVEQGKRIEKTFSQPVDLEWAHDGKHVVWLQMRPITSLEELNIYSNRISKDMLPGIIKPLVWSVNIPLVNTVWVQLLTQMIGKNDIQPESLAKSFYYRTYFNMSTFGKIFNLLGFPSEGLEMMMGITPRESGAPSFRPGMRTIKHLPRMMALGLRMWNFDEQYLKQQKALEMEVKAVPVDRIHGLDESQLMASIEQLHPIVQRIAYHNIIVPILMAMYSGMVSRQLHKIAIDPTHFDLLEGMPELETYSPDVHLRALHQQFLALPEETRLRICEGGIQAAAQESEAGAFIQALERFTSQFGHLSDSGNDFTSIPWRECPDLVLDVAINFPDEDNISDQRLRAADIKLSGMSRWMFNLFHRRARRYRLFREQISSLYTYGYGLFRPYFLELGRRFSESGILDACEDIFYLKWDEVQRIVQEGAVAVPMQATVAQRKAEIEAVRDVDLPTVIYGDETPPIIKASRDRLTGIASSRGYYTGPARVVHGIQDFSKVREGDVLVVPFSDVGWTPLFAHSGAVVAESGGMLSHASIIAREYNIPAVVSVTGAMRLADDTLLTVDGYKGEVYLHQPEEKDA